MEKRGNVPKITPEVCECERAREGNQNSATLKPLGDDDFKLFIERPEGTFEPPCFPAQQIQTEKPVSGKRTWDVSLT